VFIFRITIGWFAGARYLAKILEISNLALDHMWWMSASYARSVSPIIFVLGLNSLIPTILQ
jgi:hypothetical protein